MKNSVITSDPSSGERAEQVAFLMAVQGKHHSPGHFHGAWSSLLLKQSLKIIILDLLLNKVKNK